MSASPCPMSRPWSASRSLSWRVHAASADRTVSVGCRTGHRGTTLAPGIPTPGVGVKIGVVKEIKPQEARVALTPAGARELVARGHDVVVEAGAGEGPGFPHRGEGAAGAD